MTQAKVYINGSCYVSTTESNLCSDCHVNIDEDYHSCIKIQADHNHCKGSIWIKQQPVETQATNCNQTKGEPEMNSANEPTEVTAEEPKYTLAEFLEAYDAYIADDDTYMGLRDEFLLKYLLRFSSPEYKEYLRLKAIYG